VLVDYCWTLWRDVPKQNIAGSHPLLVFK
jgi:hypothetical protein